MHDTLLLQSQHMSVHSSGLHHIIAHEEYTFGMFAPRGVMGMNG